MRERDTQRQRVYDAEKVIWPMGKRFEARGEVSAYVKSLLATKWARRRWATFLLNEENVTHYVSVTIRAGRGCNARPQGYFGVNMALAKWGMHEAVVLHELSHGVTRRGPWHGWEFCKNYLELVRFRMGKEAEKALRDSFRAHRVKYRAPRKHKNPAPSPGSCESSSHSFQAEGDHHDRLP